MLKLKTRNNQNKVSLHFPKTNLWPLSALSFEWNMHQFQLSVLIYLPLSLQLECVYEHSIALPCQQDLQPTYKRNLEARMSSCQSSTASPQRHFVLRLFGERALPAPPCFTGECQKHCSTSLCEPGAAKFYPKQSPLDWKEHQGICNGRVRVWLGLPLSDSSISPETLAAFSSENECRKHVGAASHIEEILFLVPNTDLEWDSDAGWAVSHSKEIYGSLSFPYGGAAWGV